MKHLIYSALFLFGFLLLACSSNKNDDAEQAKKNFVHEIDSLQKKMAESENINTIVAGVLVKKYNDYYVTYPEDTINAEYLFRAGGLARAIGKSYEAIDLFKIIAEKFPSYKYAPEALFQQGIIYDSDLNNDASAKVVYESVIAKYPQHQYAKDAKQLIEYLGKTDEEIIEMFNKKNGVEQPKP